MKQRSEILSMTAILLALVAVAAVILFFLDTRGEIDTLRQAQQAIERHPHLTQAPVTEATDTTGHLREVEEQVAAIRRDLLSLAKTVSENRAAQDAIQMRLDALDRPDTTPETPDPAAAPTALPAEVLREHAMLIAALRADLAILTKRIERLPGTTPRAPAPDDPDAATPGFSPDIRQLDPLEQESAALQRRIEALQAMLDSDAEESDTSTLIHVMKRLEVLEQLLVDSTRPEKEADGAVALAELEDTVGEILALLAGQKDAITKLEESLAGTEDGHAALQTRLNTLGEDIRKEMERRSQTQESFNESSTRQTLALRERIEQVSRELAELQARGGLSPELEAQLAASAESLARLQGEMREMLARTAPPPVYHFTAADGTYIVNPHTGFDALLLRMSFVPGKAAPVYTFLRIPFDPQGKRISRDALPTDDSVGGIRALNTELVALDRARSLPYSRMMPEIYYFTTNEGTFVLNPHAGTTAVLHITGSTRFIAVTGSMRPQRIHDTRLVADGIAGGLTCLNFRLTYFGHNRTFEFE